MRCLDFLGIYISFSCPQKKSYVIFVAHLLEHVVENMWGWVDVLPLKKVSVSVSVGFFHVFIHTFVPAFIHSRLGAMCVCENVTHLSNSISYFKRSK